MIIRPVRVLIIDHHSDVRLALNYLLNQQVEMVYVGEADNVTDLISHLSLTNADFILLDWELLEANHAEDLVTAVKSKMPKPKIIAMSMKAEDKDSILALGVDGFINKREPSNLLTTIQRLCS